MATFDPARGGLTHAGTFNNNAFTMAVGAVSARRSSTPTSLAAVNERGDRLRAGLQARFDAVAAAVLRHRVGLAAVRPPGRHRRADLDDADPAWRDLFFHDLLDAGFYPRPRGYWR